ncbi:MAG: response regulator [Thermoleophilia bacterium]
MERIEQDAERGQAATVLVIEDEDAIRELTRRVLEREGYEVLVASDGEAAVEVSRGREGRIDLLVTDLVMPRMCGTEAVERLAAHNPTLRVLFVSGYMERSLALLSGFEYTALDPDRALSSALHAEAGFLAKPFTPRELTRKVRELLDCAECALA